MSRASHQHQHQRPVASAEPPPCPRKALVEGLERCIGSFFIASSEFKAAVQSSKYRVPDAHGSGGTLHDPLQSLSDMYRTQSELFARNARLDQAVKRLASEMFDLLGIEHFRGPFHRYAQAVGMVYRKLPSQDHRYPLSGLPSPPRDIAIEESVQYQAPVTLAPNSAHQSIPNRSVANHSGEKGVSQFHFPQDAPLQSAGMQYVSPSPITSMKRSATMSAEGRPSCKRHLERWPSTAAPFVIPDQQRLRSTGKTINYEEIFFERKAQRRQDISRYEGKFYVFQCDLHGESKIFKTAHDARLHLARSRLHGLQNATLVDAVEDLGVEVLNCNGDQMESCNKISWQMRKEEKKVKAIGKSELVVVNDLNDAIADELRAEQPGQACESWAKADRLRRESQMGGSTKGVGSEMGNKPTSNVTRLTLEIPKGELILESTKEPTPRQPFANMEDGLNISDRELDTKTTREVQNGYDEVNVSEPEVIEIPDSTSCIMSSRDSENQPEEVGANTLTDDVQDCIEVSVSSMYNELSEGEIREETNESAHSLAEPAEELCIFQEAKLSTPKKHRRRRLKVQWPKFHPKCSSPPSENESEPESRFCPDSAWRTKESPKRRNDARPGDEFRPHGCVHCPRRFTFKSELKMHIFDEHKKKNQFK